MSKAVVQSPLTRAPARVNLARPEWESARILATGFADDSRLAFARAFTVAALRSYWLAFGAEGIPFVAPKNLALRDLGGDAERIAVAFGLEAAAREPQAACHLLGSVYAAAMPDKMRSELGAFYTPPALVDRLVGMATDAIDWRVCRMLDPAAGTGAFLVSLALRMVEALGEVDPSVALRSVAGRLKGYEIDPFAAWLAQTFVEAALLPLVRRCQRRLPRLVEIRDSLAGPFPEPGNFDLVIGNPPYGRVSLAPERRLRFARCLFGHANLYALFTDAAIRWVRVDGIIAYVTPTSMLGGEYHKSLRRLLAEEAPPMAIDVVAERAGVFAEVLQETMLAVYRRAGRPIPASVGFLSVGDKGAVVTAHAGSFHLPDDPAMPWMLPRARSQARLVTRLRWMPNRLADYGYAVSTGPLVWNRHKPQFLDRFKPGALPVIWAESVGGDGLFRYRAEKRNHAPWFAVGIGDRWLVIDNPCVLVQRTTAKEQDRRLIAAELPAAFLREHGGAVVENHLNMVRATMKKPLVPPAIVAAILNSRVADNAFRCINGSVAVSAFELEALPLPPPAVALKLLPMVRRGACRAEIDAAIARLYG